MHHKPASGQATFSGYQVVIVKSGALFQEAFTSGQVVYSDQLTARVKDRGLPARSGVGQKEEYSGGTVFYDAESKFLCVELQVGYTAIETIKSKLRFVCLATDMGVKIHSYHTDMDSTTQMSS